MNTSGYCPILASQYLESLEVLQQAKTKLQHASPCKDTKDKLKVINSMLDSTRYAYEWLVDCREPGNRREITQMSYEQRTIYIGDLDVLAFLGGGKCDTYAHDEEDDFQSLALKEAQRVIDTFPPKMKECFLLHKVEGHTIAKTAELLGINKGTMKTQVFRAYGKIHNQLAKLAMHQKGKRG
ncbi:MAG: hypothetical protein LBV67_08350 [Streptococcaceae bacterium]|jgi:hypothetical protein|nr:hypothetical protein [Streptococcaceae bacterium]